MSCERNLERRNGLLLSPEDDSCDAATLLEDEDARLALLLALQERREFDTCHFISSLTFRAMQLLTTRGLAWQQLPERRLRTCERTAFRFLSSWLELYARWMVVPR